MKRFISKKTAAVGAAAGLALGMTGAAVAYWSSSGTGSGSATTGTSTAFVVVVDNVNLADLTPGGPSDTVSYSVTNTNTGHQFLAQTDVYVPASFSAQADLGKPACTAADFSVDGEAAGATHTETPNSDLASGGVHNDSVTVQMVNLASNQDNCQGVTVPLTVDAS
jgi:hypothetical protein